VARRGKTGGLIRIKKVCQNNWNGLFANQKSGLAYRSLGDSLRPLHMRYLRSPCSAGSGFAIRRRPRLGMEIKWAA